MLNVEQGGIKYHFFFFLVFGMTRHGIEPRFSGPLANTLTNRPMEKKNYLYAFILDQSYRNVRLRNRMLLCFKNISRVLNDALFSRWKTDFKMFIIWVYMYLPNPSARAGSDIMSMFLSGLNCFQFRFFLPDRLPYQGLRTQSAKFLTRR